VALPEPAEKLRKQLLNPWLFRLGLVKTLPLAAAAGLRLRRLDEEACVVSLPGGWRTQNPFRSTYFAAQAMAAEMSTGAPAAVLVRGASASVSMLVTGIRAVFTKKIVGESVFTFSEVAAMRDVVDQAARSEVGEGFLARSLGRTADGTMAAEFEITWSFKRRTTK
jgi:Domain of unknown function (DUF4442)